MSYNNMNEAIAKLEELEATIAAYNHAMGVMWVDAATAAPEDSAEGRTDGQRNGAAAGSYHR